MGLIRVQLAEEGPEELTSLGQEVPKAHISGYVACVGLEVIIKAAEILTDLAGVIKVDLSIFLKVVFFEIYKAQSYVIFKLEELENQGLYVIFCRKLEASVAWIVHIYRTDGWRNHCD